MAIVYLPDGSRVEVDDGEDLREASRRIALERGFKLGNTAKQQEDEGPRGILGEAWYGLRRGLHSLRDIGPASEIAGGYATGDRALMESGIAGLKELEAYRDTNLKPTASFEEAERRFGQGEYLGSAGEFLRAGAGTAGEALGFMVPGLLTTPFTGGVGAAAPLATRMILRGGIAALPQTPFYGASNLGRQVEEGRTADDIDVPAAAIAAPGQSFLDMLLGVGGRAGAKMAWETVLKSVGTGAMKGILTEVPTEIIQQGLERWQAGLSPWDDNALREYRYAAYGAGMLGGGAGVATRLRDRGNMEDRPEAPDPLKVAREQADEIIRQGDAQRQRELERVAREDAADMQARRQADFAGNIDERDLNAEVAARRRLAEPRRTPEQVDAYAAAQQRLARQRTTAPATDAGMVDLERAEAEVVRRHDNIQRWDRQMAEGRARAAERRAQEQAEEAAWRQRAADTQAERQRITRETAQAQRETFAPPAVPKTPQQELLEGIEQTRSPTIPIRPPLAESVFARNYVEAMPVGNGVHVPLFQQHLKESTGRVVTLREARDVLDQYAREGTLRKKNGGWRRTAKAFEFPPMGEATPAAAAPAPAAAPEAPPVPPAPIAPAQPVVQQPIAPAPTAPLPASPVKARIDAITEARLRKEFPLAEWKAKDKTLQPSVDLYLRKRLAFMDEIGVTPRQLKGMSPEQKRSFEDGFLNWQRDAAAPQAPVARPAPAPRPEQPPAAIQDAGPQPFYPQDTIEEIDDAIERGQGDAILAPEIPYERSTREDGTGGIMRPGKPVAGQFVKALENKGWVRTAPNEFEKGDWYGFFRSQGKLAPPIFQWAKKGTKQSLFNPDFAESEIEAETYMRNLQRKKPLGPAPTARSFPAGASPRPAPSSPVGLRGLKDPEVAKRIEEFARTRIGKIASKDLTVELIRGMMRSNSGSLAEGQYEPMRRLMRISVDPLMYRQTGLGGKATGYEITLSRLSEEQQRRYIGEIIDHETIHDLKGTGRFRKDEWAALEKYAMERTNARRGKSFFQDVSERYKNEGLSQEDMVEEAIAEAFRFYSLAPYEVPAKPRSVFRKIMDFFRTLMRMPVETGLAPEQIMDMIRSGEIGSRPDGELRSAAPVREALGTPANEDVESVAALRQRRDEKRLETAAMNEIGDYSDEAYNLTKEELGRFAGLMDRKMVRGERMSPADEVEFQRLDAKIGMSRQMPKRPSNQNEPPPRNSIQDNVVEPLFDDPMEEAGHRDASDAIEFINTQTSTPTPQQIAEAIRPHLNDRTKVVLDHIMNLPQAQTVKIELWPDRIDADEDAGGDYVPDQHKVRIAVGERHRHTGFVFMHEMLHAITVRDMIVRQLRQDVTGEQDRVLKAYDFLAKDIFRALAKSDLMQIKDGDVYVTKRGWRAQADYAFSNPFELISVGMTQPAVQKVLEETPASTDLLEAVGLIPKNKQSLWQALVAAVRRAFGFDLDQESILAQLMHVTEKLGEERRGKQYREGDLESYYQLHPGFFQEPLASRHGPSQIEATRNSISSTEDEEMRRYRAEEQGFDTRRTWYHATKNKFDAFNLAGDPTSHTGGGAIWLRANPRANVSAHQTGIGFSADGARNIPAWLRLSKEVEPARYQELGLNRHFPFRVTMDENRRLREMGYTHAIGGTGMGEEVAVFDPANIRSVHAQFDPAKTGSSDLLASISPVPLDQAMEKAHTRAIAKAPTVVDQINTHKADFWTKARIAITDKRYGLERLERVINDNKLLKGFLSPTVAVHMADRSPFLAAAAMRIGKAIVKQMDPNDPNSKIVMVEDGQSLEDVLREVVNKGLEKQFDLYLRALREKDLRQKNGQGWKSLDMTDAEINQAIALGVRHPELVAAKGKFETWNRQLMEFAHAAGLIDDNYKQKFLNDLNYVSFYRQIGEELVGPKNQRGIAAGITVHPIGRSTDKAIPMMEAMIRNANFWIEAGVRNIAAQKSLDFLTDIGAAREVTRGSPAGKGQDVLRYRKNGKEHTFVTSDPYLYTALGSGFHETLPWMVKWMGFPARVLREAVTRAPDFWFANMIRDAFSTWVARPDTSYPIADQIQGYTKALRDTTSHRMLRGLGVVGGHDIGGIDPSDAAKVFRNEITDTRHKVFSFKNPLSGIKLMWDYLGKMSQASDSATRLPIFERVLKETGDPYEAAFRAMEIINFSKSGASMGLRLATSMIPFLNARIQGMDVFWQGMRNNPKQFLARGMVLTAAALMLAQWNNEDEEYNESVPKYVRDTNLLIPLKWFGKDGGFLAIPKPFEIGLFFQTIPEYITRVGRGQDSTREAWKTVGAQLSSTFGVSPLPQAVMPIIENISNHSFWTGLPVQPSSTDDLDPTLRFTANTMEVAKVMSKWSDDAAKAVSGQTGAKLEGFSPVSIEHIIRGYGGTLGTYMAEAASHLLREMGPGQPPTVPMEQLPVMRRFLKTAENTNPKMVNDFYELAREVTQATRTVARLKLEGDEETLDKYREEKEGELSIAKPVNRIRDRLSKLRRLEVQTIADRTMDGDEKREILREIRQERLELTRVTPDLRASAGVR